jgi:hypothetical protein
LKILDAHGNELRDGDMVSWSLPGGGKILVRLAKVVPPGTIAKKNGDPAPGHMDAEFVIDLQPGDRSNISMADMVKTHDPKAEAAPSLKLVQ